MFFMADVFAQDTLETTQTETKSSTDSSAVSTDLKPGTPGSIEIGTEGTRLKISGNAWLAEGQIEKGFSTAQASDLDHSWIQQATGSIKLEMSFDRRTHVVVEGEGDLLFSNLITLWDKEFVEDQKAAKLNFWLKQAEGTYTFGNLENGTYPLQIGVGEFEYKYNPDVRNLGEYLFRASAYPVYFLNWADGAYYRMAGLRGTTQPVDWFKFDALLFSEIYQLPLQDFSVAGVATFKIGKLAEIGAGIDFNRLFSVDNSKTTMKSGARLVDNIYSLDSIGADSAGKAIADTSYYTFKSTKIAFRASIDLKTLLDFQFWGAEDLKLYAEYAILGLENFPAHNSPTGNDFYSKISERSPIMVGFNFPTCKILDVLAIELEEFKSPYIPSSYNTFKFGLPTPVPASQYGKSVHDVKWSVYAKKRLGAMQFVGQVARDHFQPGNNNVSYTERGDVMTTGKDWWWMLKVQFGY